MRHPIKAGQYTQVRRHVLWLVLLALLPGCATRGAGPPLGGGGPRSVVATAVMGGVVRLDAFEQVLRLAGVDNVQALPARDAPFTPEDAAALYDLLLDKAVTLANFGPRLVASSLLREVMEGEEELHRDVLLQRVERFEGLAVLRPDGYLAWALTGQTQQRVGPVEWKDGAFRAHAFEVGRFYSGRNNKAFLLARLIENSPECLERFRLMTRGEQIKALSKLSTTLLSTYGAAGGTTRSVMAAGRGLEAVSVPVLTVTAEGTLAVGRVAVPAGRAVMALGGGPGAAIILQRANDAARRGRPGPAEGPGQWGPANEAMSRRSARYQEQITGHSANEAYWVGGVGKTMTSPLSAGSRNPGPRHSSIKPSASSRLPRVSPSDGMWRRKRRQTPSVDS